MKKNRIRLRRLWNQFKKDISFFENNPMYAPYYYSNDPSIPIVQKIKALAAIRVLKENGRTYNLLLPSLKDVWHENSMDGLDFAEIGDIFCMYGDDYCYCRVLTFMSDYGWNWSRISNEDCSTESADTLVGMLKASGKLEYDVRKAIEYVVDDEYGNLCLHVFTNARLGNIMAYATTHPEFKKSMLYRRINYIAAYCAVPFEHFHSDPVYRGVQDGVFYSIFSTGYNAGWDTTIGFETTLVSAPIYALYLERFLTLAETMYPDILIQDASKEVVAV